MAILNYNNRILTSNNRLLNIGLFSNAFAIFSVRNVTQLYTGYCMRVRRSSDNTELDVGFVNQELDTASLITFVGAGDGFVSKWYDQTGNGRDSGQPTLANQPQIVSSGVVITVNNKPAVYSPSSSARLSMPTSYNLGATYSFLGRIQMNVIGKEWIGGGANIYGIYNDPANLYADDTGSAYILFGPSANLSLSVPHTVELYRTTQNLSFIKDGVAYSGTPVSTLGNFILTNIYGESTTYGLIGYIQETIILSSDRYYDRTDIYNNINNYFK